MLAYVDSFLAYLQNVALTLGGIAAGAAGLVGALVLGGPALVGLLLAYALRRRARKKTKELEQAIKSQFSEAFANTFQVPSRELPFPWVGLAEQAAVGESDNTTSLVLWDKLFDTLATSAAATAAAEPTLTARGLISNPSLEEIPFIVGKSVAPLVEQLSQIQTRSSNDATLDKDSLVKIALLEKTVENLTAAVKQRDDRLLTRWDVAVVVLTILTGIGVFIGLLAAAFTIFAVVVG